MGFEFLTHSHSVPTSFGSSTSSVPRCAPWCACGLRSAAPCFAGIPIVGWRYRCCHGGSPIAGWFIMGNPIKMDDLGVTPFFEISILYMLYIYMCTSSLVPSGQSQVSQRVSVLKCSSMTGMMSGYLGRSWWPLAGKAWNMALLKQLGDEAILKSVM